MSIEENHIMKYYFEQALQLHDGELFGQSSGSQGVCGYTTVSSILDVGVPRSTIVNVVSLLPSELFCYPRAAEPHLRRTSYAFLCYPSPVLLLVVVM